jgi:hypothetical protein
MTEAAVVVSVQVIVRVDEARLQRHVAQLEVDIERAAVFHDPAAHERAGRSASAAQADAFHSEYCEGEGEDYR